MPGTVEVHILASCPFRSWYIPQPSPQASYQDASGFLLCPLLFLQASSKEKGSVGARQLSSLSPPRLANLAGKAAERAPGPGSTARPVSQNSLSGHWVSCGCSARAGPRGPGAATAGEGGAAPRSAVSLPGPRGCWLPAGGISPGSELRRPRSA